MMKTIITLFSMIIFAFTNYISAQDTLPYQLTVFQQDYSDLEQPVVVTSTFWDDFDGMNLEFPFGFDFMFFDTTINNLFLGLDFGEILQNPNLEQTVFSLLIPYSADLMSRADINGNVLTTISYLIEGQAGSRIFKGEWKNAGFYNDDEGGSFVNFQFWLYEENGDIEFHYGPSHFTLPPQELFDNGLGPVVGLVEKYDIDGNEDFDIALLLSGDPANPNIEVFYDVPQNNDAITINGQPADGTVYRFSRNVLNAVVSPPVSQLQVYPTMVDDYLTIKTDNSFFEKLYQITDLSGKVIIPKTKLQGDIIDLSDLHSGMYFIHLFKNGQMVESGRFIKT